MRFSLAKDSFRIADAPIMPEKLKVARIAAYTELQMIPKRLLGLSSADDILLHWRERKILAQQR